MTDRSMTGEAADRRREGIAWPGVTRLCGIGATRLCGIGATCRRRIVLATAIGLLNAAGAAAFPLIDATNQDQVPQGTELAAPEAQDLQHQLQIVNGLAAPAGGGWTFVPRIDAQELLTDNVEQVHSPRRADLVSYLAPGFSLVGDLSRLQMTMSYAPTLSIYARTGSLDSLTQQLNGLGSVTLVPDEAYVDVRAVSGVRSAVGGLGGLGSLGAPAGAGATAQTAIPALAGNAEGLNKNNEVQTSSFGISPYLLHDFGDWGTGKVGYSFGVTRSDTLSGFASPPFPAGGLNGQTLLTNEEIAHFVTGDIMEFLQDSIDLDVLQGQTTTDATGATLAPGIPAPPGVSTSSRVTVTDKVSYALTRELTLFATGGHEDITYSTQTVSSAALVAGAGGATPSYTYASVPGTSIHDLTWSLGATWTPNADSGLTVSYGHQNGFNSFAANGHYQATARTLLTVSYGSTLGTQLEYLQNQLNLAAANGNGTLVNGQTGGTLFGASNALAAEDGLFRTDTLAVGSSTALDRDIISLNLLMTRQTSSGVSSASSTSTSGNVTWLHQMRPDMTVSVAFAYAVQSQTTGITSALNPGDNTSLVANLAWQYQISDTLSASLRYSLLERNSKVAAYEISQNTLILGISKTF